MAISTIFHDPYPLRGTGVESSPKSKRLRGQYNEKQQNLLYLKYI